MLCLFFTKQVIREDAGNGVFVAGAREVPVSSLEECLHHLAVGEQNRCVRTCMHARVCVSWHGKEPAPPGSGGAEQVCV